MPKESEELQVTTVQQYRQREPEGFLVKCPSGMVVKMRRTLDMFVLLKAGKIPNPLAAIVQEMMDKRKVDLDLEKLDPEALQQMLGMIDECVATAVIQPKIILQTVGDELPEDALTISEVDPDDRMFIYSVAQGGTTDLASFRAVQADTMASISHGERVQPKAKRPVKAK